MSLTGVMSTVGRVGERLGSAARDHGLRGLTAEVVHLGGASARLPGKVAADVAFDLTRGVRTRGTLRHEGRLALRAAGGDPVCYQPIDPRLWRAAHATVHEDPAGTALVDLGAGRGRGLILAAETGFGRVVGVELDERLAEDAELNVRRWRSRRRSRRHRSEISVVQGDAAAYRFPTGPLVVFMHNPFGASTLRQVVHALCAGRSHDPAPAWITYLNPVHARVIEDFPQVRRHAAGRQWIVYRVRGAATASPRP